VVKLTIGPEGLRNLRLGARKTVDAESSPPSETEPASQDSVEQEAPPDTVEEESEIDTTANEPDTEF
jgi:hypothetical protein